MKPQRLPDEDVERIAKRVAELMPRGPYVPPYVPAWVGHNPPPYPQSPWPTDWPPYGGITISA